MNIKSIPWFSENSNIKNSTWKKMIDENITLPSSDDDLTVVCLQEAYGYRTGILGWSFTFISSYVTSYIPNCVQNFMNKYIFTKNKIYCTPLDIVITSVVLLNRIIPIINYGIWDNKLRIFNHNKNKSVLKYINKNNSVTNIFDYRSLFCLEPLFDSGCCIMSNKKPFYTGFEKLDLYCKENLQDRLCNKGIVWSYYKSDNKGILIMTYNLSENIGELSKLLELDQILTLQENLESILLEKEEETNIESYIIGDFKVQCYNNDNLSFRDLLANYNVAFINNFNYYIFYKNITNKLNAHIITNEINSIFKVNFEGEDEINDEDVNVVVDVVDEDVNVVVDVVDEDVNVVVDVVDEDVNVVVDVVDEEIKEYEHKGINPIYDYFKRLSPISKELEDWNMI
jgi:hypothetical protein